MGRHNKLKLTTMKTIIRYPFAIIFNNSFTRAIYVTIILFLPLVSISQTQNTIINPDWTNNGDWSGTAPGYSTNQSATFAMDATDNGNDVTINSGHTLRINAGVTLSITKKISVNSGGTLEVYGTITGSGGSSQINCDKGTFIVYPGGNVTVDDIFNAQPPGSMTVDGDITVLGTFSNKMNVTGSGCITVNSSFNNDNGSGGVMFGCTSSGTGCCIGPFNLILHYELDNTELIEYFVKSTYRLLYKRKRLYKIETHILKFIKNKLPNIFSQKDLIKAFKKELPILRAFQKDPFEQKAFRYFDFVSWLESKIENRPFAEIVKEKALISI